ncbi:C45 family autoproteolytic acyltransferase/hydolase [Metabacillus malikii]|uniref:Choloylglycine hydrolase n=1 Tax=Metabacillus malikii TaxID=1504265 RepID=A0ABT9ZCW2_9BACI|nr:C45 family peptidase [Metabacillus malikii]MDQ0230097.1 putative choloylglycine hydrolase [Metabacillus malikii]
MKNIHVNIIQARNTHYDFGYLQGEQILDSILVKNREQQWKMRRPKFTIDINEAKQAIEKWAPFIWNEFLGLQDALKWPMEKVLQEFGGYRVNLTRSGCSIYVGRDYMIRNYDYHPKTYDGRYVLFQPTDGGFATIGFTQKITGRSDGMNEKGLSMGYTFMNRKRPGDGFVCHMIGRLILECCATVSDAVAFLNEIPHRGSFSYVLFDKTCASPMIVETSPRKIAVREGYSCTNHFKILTEENRHILDDSKKRLEIVDEQQKMNLSGEEAFRLLNDTNKGVFSKLYGSWAGTIHTSAYFPQPLEAWLAIGGDQPHTKISFSNWLKGENIALQTVNGVIDTVIPFAHIERADWFQK